MLAYPRVNNPSLQRSLPFGLDWSRQLELPASMPIAPILTRYFGRMDHLLQTSHPCIFKPMITNAMLWRTKYLLVQIVQIWWTPFVSLFVMSSHRHSNWKEKNTNPNHQTLFWCNKQWWLVQRWFVKLLEKDREATVVMKICTTHVRIDGPNSRVWKQTIVGEKWKKMKGHRTQDMTNSPSGPYDHKLQKNMKWGRNFVMTTLAQTECLLNGTCLSSEGF